MPRGVPTRGFWSRRGVRSRATIVSVLVVAGAMLLGGFALAAVLKVSLTNSVGQSVQQRARDVAAEIADEDVEAAAPTIDAAPGDSTLVQVLSPAGDVLIASPSIVGEPPIVTGITPGRSPQTAEVSLPFVDGERYLVAVMTATAHDETVTVIAAQSLAPVANAYRTVLLLLLIGAPFLLAAVGLITWFAVGRGLASVDRIRSRVESIGGRDLDERVPVPAAKDEIARLAVTMNHMLARLESSAASQRQFIADASHELRSPLASMRASLDVAGLGDADGWSEAARVLGDEVDRMTRLVADLLLLAKADEGVLALRAEEVDVDDLVLEEARRLRAQTAFEIIAHVEAVQILGDRARLAQALRNLVDNAARFAQHQLRFTVSRSADDAAVTIVVDDDGPGIPVAARDAVLRRFVRQDEHRARDHGGTGLGLAITSEIVRLHGGTLLIGDSDLGGAQVSIVLPASGPPTASRR